MAQRSKAYPANAPGPFFVDSSCIDCGTCWAVAPGVFQDAGGHSLVHRQPDPGAHLRALMALLACPTAFSTYLFSTRLGADKSLMSSDIMVSTLLSMVTLSFWLWRLG